MLRRYGLVIFWRYRLIPKYYFVWSGKLREIVKLVKKNLSPI